MSRRSSRKAQKAFEEDPIRYFGNSLGSLLIWFGGLALLIIISEIATISIATYPTASISFLFALGFILSAKSNEPEIVPIITFFLSLPITVFLGFGIGAVIFTPIFLGWAVSISTQKALAITKERIEGHIQSSEVVNQRNLSVPIYSAGVLLTKITKLYPNSKDKRTINGSICTSLDRLEEGNNSRHQVVFWLILVEELFSYAEDILLSYINLIIRNDD